MLEWKQSENYTLLQVDVTKNSDEDKAFQKAFGIVGPPAILFFKNAQEMSALRVVGFACRSIFGTFWKKWNESSLDCWSWRLRRQKYLLKNILKKGFSPIENEEFAYEGDTTTHLFSTRAFIHEVVEKGLKKSGFLTCKIIFQVGENPLEAYRFDTPQDSFVKSLSHHWINKSISNLEQI